MRPASTALAVFLLSKAPYWTADMFTVTLQTGDVLYWTSSETDIVLGGHTYTSFGPLLIGGRWGMTNTMAVPELTVTMLAGNTSEYIVGGVNVKTFAHNGGFDNAVMKFERLYMPTTQPYGYTGLGAVELFNGKIGNVEINALGAVFSVRGFTVTLNQLIPKNLFQAGCAHTLYDAGCTLSAASFTISATVGAGSNDANLMWTSGETNNASYIYGYIIMTSGPASGARRTIKQTTSDRLGLADPLPATPNTGDSFTVTMGCDKLSSTCTSRFSNLQHFRGFPYVPDATLAL